ncbi:MAG: hypothetical protein ACJAS1_004388 [Oleiphilaceae bacterium]|jgi:hypothetical protein
MRFLESWEELEEKEDLLRQKINALADDKKKVYYREQANKLKDPDTYASLNWLLLGGFHHFYLGKYKLFAIEFTLLIISILGFIFASQSAVFIIIALILYELPQLFFSQKIARQHNYDISIQIYNDLNTN